MRIHGIARRRLGTDGQGVTDLVAMAGCPLSCAWCINKRLLSSGAVRDVAPEEILDSVMREACYFVATGGGVTLGGGEPLLQWREALRLAELRPGWMRLTIETSLQAPREVVEALAPLTDLWIVDIKSLDPTIYRDYAHGDASVMLGNLRALADAPGRVLARVPAIPGWKGEEAARREAEMLAGMGIGDVEVFGYVTGQAAGA